MKNIHLIPTDKPSRLFIDDGILELDTECIISEDWWIKNQHIYITSDEEIKEGDWFVKPKYSNAIKIGYEISQADSSYFEGYGYDWTNCKKIILTTDQDLIKDDVQAIDDEFLEWFVKNPSCEEVKVENTCLETKVCDCAMNENCLKPGYKIIIPEEEDMENEEPKMLSKLELAKNIAAIGIGKEEPKTNLERLPFPKLVEEFANYYKEVPLVEEPKQYPIGGYAPGYYSCTCVTCKKEFTGDKRAVQCEFCAIQMTKEEANQETLEEAAKKYLETSYFMDLSKIDYIKFGAKWQAERMGLMEIELRHTKTLLASCEKALEDRDKQAERMYSEEEVLDLIKRAVYQKQNAWKKGELDQWFEQFKKK